jgi:molybdate transport system permease protein
MSDDPLYLSLKVTLTSTLISMVLGVSIAWILARKRFPGRSLAEGISLTPLVLPPTVLGYYLLVAMGADSAIGRWYHGLTGSQLVFDFNGIVIAACIGSLPLLIRQAQVAFQEIDRDLEDAARSSGASEWQVFRHITVPLARRGIIAGTALAFARALGDFGATLMVGANLPGRTRTLPLAVYNAYYAGDGETAKRLSILLAAIAIVIGVLAARLSHRD